MGIFQIVVGGAIALAGLASAQLEQVSNYGANPGQSLMYLYVPANIGPNPAVLVAAHHCQGTAQSFYGSTRYAQLAAQHNYVVIYPQSIHSGTCWDVSSDQTLTHDGGGASQDIASMVQYTIDRVGADASRVFVAGSSSGGMMANVLAATYPELFAAVAVHSGVPAGCFYTGSVNGWNSDCSGGNVIRSQTEWADIVRDMYPGYTGEYPRMIVYHGNADTTLNGRNYDETIKQWTGIHGYDAQADETQQNTPQSPYTTYIYGDKVKGVVGNGLGHALNQWEEVDLQWFGL